MNTHETFEKFPNCYYSYEKKLLQFLAFLKKIMVRVKSYQLFNYLINIKDKHEKKTYDKTKIKIIYPFKVFYLYLLFLFKMNT